MSEVLAKTIKSLANQNLKLRNLLDSTLELVGDDVAQIARLENESKCLKMAVEELESQKLQLREELESYLVEQNSECSEQTLANALEHIQTDCLAIERLKVEDEQLLKEKGKLIEEIALLKEAVEQDSELAETRSRLEHELAISERQGTSLSCSEIVDRMAGVKNLKSKLLNELEKSKASLPLSVPTENAVIEVKISSLERRRDVLLQELRSILLRSAQEVSKLHSVTRDGRLKYLIDKMEIRKAVLIVNMMNLKESSSGVPDETHLEQSLDESPANHLEGAKLTLATVSEEKEEMGHLRAEQKVLSEEILEPQGNTVPQEDENVAPQIKEEAKSGLLGNEEEIMTVKIDELELENQRIKFELDGILGEIRIAENVRHEESGALFHGD